VRYVGSTADSCEPSSLVRWLMEEIKENCSSIAEEVPGAIVETKVIVYKNMLLI